MMKTNPLLKLNGMGNDFFNNENTMSDGSEHMDGTMDPPHSNSHKVRNILNLRSLSFAFITRSIMNSLN